jgi:hypothetical protein
MSKRKIFDEMMALWAASIVAANDCCRVVGTCSLRGVTAGCPSHAQYGWEPRDPLRDLPLNP